MLAVLWAVLVVLGIVLVASVYLYRSNRAQLQVHQARIEVLIEDIGSKNLLVDRGLHAMRAMQTELLENSEELTVVKSSLQFQQEQYAKLLGQKKSSEVRTGKITEQLAPFLEDYPLDPKTAKFLGDPIDFVHFDEEKITFVEVKSGKSQLSKKQRMIRDLIKDGKVEFTIYRVEGK